MSNVDISYISFKGYDARPLKGFLMSSNQGGIAREMQAIANRERFKLYTIDKRNSLNYTCKEGLPESDLRFDELWAQDWWTIIKDKLLYYEANHSSLTIKNFFSLKDNFTQKILREDPKYLNEVKNLWKIFFPETKADRDNKTTLKEIWNNYAKQKSNIEKLQKQHHISGGNIFIVKGNKKDELIIGENELKFFSKQDIIGLYKLSKITILPQMDYHLDLFIRPLDKKRILLADDKLTLEILNLGLKKLDDYILTSQGDEKNECLKIRNKMQTKIRTFQDLSSREDMVSADIIEKILKNKGFKTIRVPGRFYNDIIKAAEEEDDDENILIHECNYMNANVLKNQDGKLVYITNKSNIEKFLGLTPEICKKINFNYEEEFIKSISPFVDREHIYFIKGKDDFVARKMLNQFHGGIHCACTEIPHGVRINPEVVNAKR